jgi:glycosyltransferase involved in cell wall biosynthesis
VTVRVLVISYSFPPVGGAGVQRVLKLVKYLPQSGVVPTVLTSREASVPTLDASLEHEVPESVEILRARTLEPRYAKKDIAWQSSARKGASPFPRATAALVSLARRLLVPDPQVLWLPAAGGLLVKRLASKHADDVVFISGPPFSQFLLAPLARLRTGTALVLDYRDEWTTTSSSYEMSSSPRAAMALERFALRRAHAVTTATEAFRTSLLERFPFLDERRVTAIPNGYDPEDFCGELPSPPSDRFVLAYVGTVFRLTSARGFLAGLRLFHAREPALAAHLEVRFAGRIVPTEADAFEGTEALGVRRLGYLEHRSAICELAKSHAALCILDAVSGVERIYPAKIFEIMRLGRPCLALAPPGSLADLVRQCRAGEVVAPRDAEAIALLLERWLRRFRANPTAFHAAPVGIERFDRRRLARVFAACFREALSTARGDSGATAPLLRLPDADSASPE